MAHDPTDDNSLSADEVRTVSPGTHDFVEKPSQDEAKGIAERDDRPSSRRSPNDYDARQYAAEADRVAGTYHDAPGVKLIPRDEVVAPVQECDYVAPAFVRQTGGDPCYERLQELLHRLLEVNREHEGEKTLEIQAYYLLTGGADELQEGFRLWAEDYFTRRSEPRNLTPMLLNDPLMLFAKLLDEMDQVLLRYLNMEGTLNSTFLRTVLNYVVWLLHQRLGVGRISKRDGYVVFDPPPANRGKVRVLAANLEMSGWPWRADLKTFLELVSGWADGRKVAELARLPENELRVRLRDSADDIQQMRPFLVRNFRAHKTALSFGEGTFVAWNWWTNGDIGRLLVGATPEQIQHDLARGRTSLDVVVGRDGVLACSRVPWGPGGRCHGPEQLALNVLVLERFRDRLFTDYDKIPIARLGIEPKADAPTADEEGPTDFEKEAEDVATGCRLLVLAADAESQVAPAEARRRVPGLRQGKFVKLLTECFDCEVRQGKGSELVAYRPGGRHHVLGHHKRAPEVYPEQVTYALKRLGISIPDFVAAAAR